MNRLPDIEPFRKRYEELDARMAEPDFFADSRRAAELSREHQKLGRLLGMVDEIRKLESDLANNQAMVREPDGDPELIELAREEIPELEQRLEAARKAALFAMIPPDPADSRNTILEIRAGTGGDEATLFAGDLFCMYLRYAETKGWKVEQMSESASEAGGYKEVIALVSGTDVYKNLKYESGVHRVQRVPVTEASGRIHTSAATVAVLPEAEEVDVRIDPGDLEISIARASGPGGQGVNTTDSAVQILHKPTGMIVKCADERSQIKNRAKAMTVLRSRLLEQREREERDKYAQHRKSQVGSGDRSERIRTYNFPQGRLTDHRINLTVYNLESIIQGDLDEVVEALQNADLQQRAADLHHA